MYVYAYMYACMHKTYLELLALTYVHVFANVWNVLCLRFQHAHFVCTTSIFAHINLTCSFWHFHMCVCLCTCITCFVWDSNTPIHTYIHICSQNFFLCTYKSYLEQNELLTLLHTYICLCICIKLTLSETLCSQNFFLCTYKSYLELLTLIHVHVCMHVENLLCLRFQHSHFVPKTPVQRK